MKLFTIMEVHDTGLAWGYVIKSVHVVAEEWDDAARIWESYRIKGSDNEMSLIEAFIDWRSERDMARCSFAKDETVSLTKHEFWKASALTVTWIDGERVEPVWHVVAL